MGWGDDLMATGAARRLCENFGQPVDFGYDSPVFELSPYVKTGGIKVPNNNPAQPRPYVMGKIGNRVVWNPNFRAIPGEIVLKEEKTTPLMELGGFWVIEPHVKGKFTQNKDWGFENWQKVAESLSIRLIQFNGPYLAGVERVKTDSFVHALQWMKAADGYIGPEGGLHHAAAAFRKPAVVVFGGYIHPQVTGYDFHTNLGGDWCGRRESCTHCREKLGEIKPEQVVEAVAH